MKRYLLVVIIITFILCLLNKAGAQGNQTVTNGNNTDVINFPGAGCVYNWVNNTPGIGISANGTGDIASFKAINTTTSPITATITATPVSPGYAYVANYNDGTVSVLNITTNALVTTITVGTNPYGVAISLDGSRVYVTNQGSATISVINTTTNDVAAIIPVSNGSPGGVAVSPDGSKLYVANQNANKVSVFNTATYALLSTIKVGSSPLGVIISPDGGRVYVSNYQGSSVSVINTANNTVLKTIAVKEGPLGLAISADGKRLYVADELSDKISIINTVNNAVLTTIDGGTGPYNLALNKDGSRLFVADYIADKVTIISTADNTILSVILLNKAPFGVSVSPDGNQVYVTNSGSGDVSVINAVAYSLTTSIKTGSGPYSLGNFITTGTSCNSSPVTFTITVNPTTTAGQAIVTSDVTGSIFACQGTTSVSPDIQQFSVSGRGLSGNITATAPAGFEVSLAADNGYGNSVTLAQSGGKVNDVFIYIRSSASAPTGGISGNVTLASAGVSTVYVIVRGKINALPTINPVADQSVTNGAFTIPVNFTGTGNTFLWTTDTPGIGLPASGDGDIASFKAINTGTTPVTATITATPVSPGYAYVPFWELNNVSVINTVTNKVVAKISTPEIPFTAMVSPDGSKAYVLHGGDDKISIINTATNTLIPNNLSLLNDQATGLTISPDGNQIYISTAITHSIYVIDAVTNTLTRTIPFPFNLEFLVISPDRKTLYGLKADETSNTSQWSQVLAIDIATGSIKTTFSYGNAIQNYQINGICLSPDGGKLYLTVGGDDKLLVLNTTTGATYAIPVGNNPNSVCTSPDGSRIYVTNPLSGTLSVINAATNIVITNVPLNTAVWDVAVSPDGRRIYVTCPSKESQSVLVLDAATNAVITQVNLNHNNGYATWGNFVAGGSGCNGAPITFKITINPATAIITASLVTGTISGCLGSASSSPNIQQFSVSGSSLTTDITATAPPGFEVSLAPSSGYAGSVILKQTGGKVNSVKVYVRSAAQAPVGSHAEAVVLTAEGASDLDVMVNSVVNELPTAIQPDNQTVASGTATAAVYFASAATSFAWTNDTPGIGLPASGTGDIPAFTAVNNGSTPLVATISVIPFSSNTGCSGVPVKFNITVKPSSVSGITAGAVTGNISACAGAASASPDIQQFTVSGGSLTSDIIATASNGFEVSLAAGSGYGNSVTLKQSGGTVNNVVVYVRSSALAPTGNIPGKVTLTSIGTSSREVVVSGNVNALPVISVNNPTQTVISGQSTSPINFTGAGGVVHWVNDKPGIGLPASNDGDIASFVAVNNGVIPITATITAIPVSAGGCSGAPVKVTIIVSQSVPVDIIATGALSPLGTVYGTPSASTSFTVSGTGLTAGILVTPPPGFEVSTDNIIFKSTLTIAGAARTVSPAPVYIRLAAKTHAGIYQGDIVLSGPGKTIKVAMPNSIVIPAPLTITADDKSKTYNAANPPLTISYKGFVNNEDATKLVTQALIITTANTASAPGRYPVIAYGAASPDYTISYVNGVLTVNEGPKTIVIPNAFTPNGDGINDVWNIKYLDTYKNCTVKIYNRYGQNVFESVGYGVAWDGKYKGSYLPTGTYYYIIDLKDGLALVSGYVAIIR